MQASQALKKEKAPLENPSGALALFLLSARRVRSKGCAHDASLEIDQVLKYQVPPTVAVRLHQQPTGRKPPELDG